ncbi:MAG: hypothetical protein ABSF26_01815 [Thermoguttaceae bacterium]
MGLFGYPAGANAPAVPGEVGVDEFFPVLVKDGPLGLLEDDVIPRISGLELRLYLFFEVVVGVLGLPQSVAQHLTQRIDDGSVRLERFLPFSLELVFGHQCAAGLPRTLFQKGLEGRSDGPLVLDAEPFKLPKHLVVGLDGLVRGFEVQRGHKSTTISMPHRRRPASVSHRGVLAGNCNLFA